MDDEGPPSLGMDMESKLRTLFGYSTIIGVKRVLLRFGVSTNHYLVPGGSVIPHLDPKFGVQQVVVSEFGKERGRDRSVEP